MRFIVAIRLIIKSRVRGDCHPTIAAITGKHFRKTSDLDCTLIIIMKTKLLMNLEVECKITTVIPVKVKNNY